MYFPLIYTHPLTIVVVHTSDHCNGLKKKEVTFNFIDMKIDFLTYLFIGFISITPIASLLANTNHHFYKSATYTSYMIRGATAETSAY